MEWRKTFLPFYEVSEYGDLRLLTNRSNRLAGTILKGSVKAGGYREYKIRWEGKEYHLGAHRLVLLAFVGEPPTPEHQCAHWDGDPTNNHHSNLRWATPAENKGHRTFTKEQVREMRKMHEDGKSYRDIRQTYQISKGNLSAIINRQTWDWLL